MISEVFVSRAAHVDGSSVGLLAGGVIGGVWAARLRLNGIDVRIFDPDGRAVERVEERGSAT